jgi:uncharacterized membrane protein
MQKIANGLGWFSLGLGLAEVAAPGAVANLIGIRDDNRNRSLLRSPLYGMREIAAGAGILTQQNPASWMWGRVAGDLLDLSTLAVAMQSDQNDRRRVTTAMAAVMGVTALDLICAQQLSRESVRSSVRPREFHHALKTITVNKSPEEVYRFWRNLENLPSFMQHLESVQTTGDGRSHWRAIGPGGKPFQWDAEIVRDEPNRLIEWRSLEGSEVENSGSVRFELAGGGRGTVIRVELQYDAPGGAFGRGFAKLLGREPGQQIDDDLRAFKQVMETGEVVRSDASIHMGMHPAQPPA